MNLTKENTKWKRLCRDHANEIMICPCWIVEKDECQICGKQNIRMVCYE